MSKTKKATTTLTTSGFTMKDVDLKEKQKIVLYKNHKHHLKNIMLIAQSSVLLVHDEH